MACPSPTLWPRIAFLSSVGRVIFGLILRDELAGQAGGLLGPPAGLIAPLLLSKFVSQRLLPILAVIKKEDLVALKELMEAGRVTPVIGRTYPLSDVPQAIRYLEAGHAVGKAVITFPD